MRKPSPTPSTRRASPAPSERHTCGECALGTPVMKHEQLDLHGQPICVRCPYQKWARIRSEAACKKFKPKAN